MKQSPYIYVFAPDRRFCAEQRESQRHRCVTPLDTDNTIVCGCRYGHSSNITVHIYITIYDVYIVYTSLYMMYTSCIHHYI